MLQCLSVEYDVIAITETWCNACSDMVLYNFDVYASVRSGIGGGTAIYVRSNLQSARFVNFIHNNSNEFEVTCTTIRPSYMPKTVSIIAIVCIYIPPNCNKSTQYKLFKSLTSLFENIRNKYAAPGFLILGDFNKWKYASSVSSALSLKQIIDFPTFFRENQNQSSKFDCVFTDLSSWYSQPQSLPPLKVNATYHVCIQLKPKKPPKCATCRKQE